MMYGTWCYAFIQNICTVQMIQSFLVLDVIKVSQWRANAHLYGQSCKLLAQALFSSQIFFSQKRLIESLDIYIKY